MNNFFSIDKLYSDFNELFISLNEIVASLNKILADLNRRKDLDSDREAIRNNLEKLLTIINTDEDYKKALNELSIKGWSEYYWKIRSLYNKMKGKGSYIAWMDSSRRESGWTDGAPQEVFGYHDWYDDRMDILFDIHATMFELDDFTLRLWKGDYGKRKILLPGELGNTLGGAGGEIGFYNDDETVMTVEELDAIGLTNTKIEVYRKGTGEYVASREEKPAVFWTTTFSWDRQAKPKELYTINTLTFKSEAVAEDFSVKLKDKIEEAKDYPHNNNESIVIDPRGCQIIIIWGKN